MSDATLRGLQHEFMRGAMISLCCSKEVADKYEAGAMTFEQASESLTCQHWHTHPKVTGDACKDGQFAHSELFSDVMLQLDSKVGPCAHCSVGLLRLRVAHALLQHIHGLLCYMTIMYRYMYQWYR